MIKKLLFKTMLVSVGQSVIKWELVEDEVSIQGKMKLAIFSLFFQEMLRLFNILFSNGLTYNFLLGLI